MSLLNAGGPSGKQILAKGGATVFEDGVMPELPPPREVTVWDF